MVVKKGGVKCYKCLEWSELVPNVRDPPYLRRGPCLLQCIVVKMLESNLIKGERSMSVGSCQIVSSQGRVGDPWCMREVGKI